MSGEFEENLWQGSGKEGERKGMRRGEGRWRRREKSEWRNVREMLTVTGRRNAKSKDAG